MRKLTQLEKFGLVAGVVVAMSYFYLQKVYDPQAKALDKTVKELNKVAEELKTLQTVEPFFKIQGKLDGKKKELAQIDKELSTLIVPSETEAQLNALQHKILKAAEHCGLMTASMTPGGVEQSIFSWRVYRMELLGGYGQFTAFLDALKELPALVQVGDIVLVGDKEGRGVRVAIDLRM